MSQETDGFSDALVLKSLAKLILKYKIGGYGKEFFGDYLSSKKQVFKENKLKKKGR